VNGGLRCANPPYGLKESLPLQRVPANADVSDQTFYNSKDPARYHLMPNGLSPRGSAVWLTLDHLTKREHWVERRDLAERMLAMGNEIIPAGILEAQERAAQQHTPPKGQGLF